MLGDIPAALIQLVLATATKDSLRAVASTCTALWREARLAAKRSLILGSSAHPAQAGSASSSGTRETFHAETTLLHAETGCDPNLGQPPRAVAQGAVVVVSDCALLPDGTICVAACAPSKLVRMAPDGTVLGQVSVDGCWPRALAVTRAACFVTTMPADVDTTEAPDYPSTRVVRVALTHLLNAGAGTPTVATTSVELQWCELDEPTPEDAADDSWWGPCEPGTTGAPICLAASAQRLFVLHRLTEMGSRPWEYADVDWENIPDSVEERYAQSRRRARPQREHTVSIFENDATRPTRVISLGEWARFKAPEGLAAHDGLLYVNQRVLISVFDTKGGEPIRTFSLEQPQWILASRSRMPMEIFAVANGRVYCRDGTALRVCDLEGKLMQSVELAPDSRGDSNCITSLVGGARRDGMRWTQGLLVSNRQLHFFSHAVPHPGFLGPPWHSGPTALVLHCVGIRDVD